MLSALLKEIRTQPRFMSNSSKFSFQWDRYWVSFGENLTMNEGFFVEPKKNNDVTNWFSDKSNGVSLNSLKEIPCLVLLGDVGMGKSTILAEEVQRLRNDLKEEDHNVILVDLKRVHHSQIIPKIFKEPATCEWISGKKRLTLFIDSLDECWRRVEELESILIGELERIGLHSKPPFFLRLACRSAEWRGEVGNPLRRLFNGDDESTDNDRVYVLAPLSKENIQNAAESVKCDSQKLLDTFATKRIQSLANHPVTFNMLLEEYLEGGALPESRVDLYERGCLRLCGDRHSGFPADGRRSTSPRQRLIVAARIAATCIFSNRLMVNSDPETISNRTDVLNISDVWGYRAEDAGGQKFDIDERSTRETLRTALFSERKDDVQVWRHQSYAEFLAAWYIFQRNLDFDRAIELLTDNSEGKARTVPQLEETVCWWAEINPAVLDALSENNAEVFIRCGAADWSSQQRQNLINSYLSSVEQHESPQLDWQIKSQFKRLYHSEIGKQLQTVITDRERNPLVREMAVDIAGSCELKEVAGSLVSVFVDSDDVFRVRKHAGIALEKMCDDKIGTTLKRSCRMESLTEDTDDLRGFYLNMLWPTHLALNEALSILTKPKQTNYIGAYYMFLENQFVGKLKIDDLGTAIEWIMENQISFDGLSPYGQLGKKVFLRCIKNFDNPGVRKSMLKLFQRDYSELYHLNYEIPEEISIKESDRQEYWEMAIKSDCDLQSIIYPVNPVSIKILSIDDFSWIAEKINNSSNERNKDRWCLLLFHVFNYEDLSHLNVVSRLAEVDESIASELAEKTSLPLKPDEENWAKKQYYDSISQKVEPEQPAIQSVSEQIEKLLYEFGSGKIHAFWGIAELLQKDPNDDSGVSWTSKLSDGNAWRSLNQGERNRILELIPTYLESQEVKESEIWDQEHNYRSCQTALLLILLLYDEAVEALLQLSVNCWNKWSPVIIVYYSQIGSDRDEVFRELLYESFDRGSNVVLLALERFLSYNIYGHRDLGIIWCLDKIWCDPVENLFFVFLQQLSLGEYAAQEILYMLIEYTPNRLKDWCETEFDSRKNRNAVSRHVPVAGAVMLTGFPEEFGKCMYGHFESDVLLGKAIATRVCNWLGKTEGWIGWMERLSADLNCKFWNWVFTNFLEDMSKENQGKNSTVTVSHEIFLLRDNLFQVLTNRNTHEACFAIEELMNQKPDEFWLGDVLATMKRRIRQFRWSAPSPSNLLLALCGNRRLMRTSRDLQLTVLESLKNFENELHSSTPSLELWNVVRLGKKVQYDPREENIVSDCLKRYFERDLEKMAVISNREVQIRRRFGEDSGQVVDIKIDAVPFDENGKPDTPITIIVEAKCSWNSGLYKDMRRQLRDRYLSSENIRYGIYLVVYFSCEKWNRKGDHRKSSNKKKTMCTISAKLKDQARELSSEGKFIESIVIDARLP